MDAWLTETDVGRTLDNYSVATDDEYLAKRDSLPPEIRKILDRARYEATRHVLPADDPFLLASAVPLDLGSLPLDHLILSTRCRRVLAREGIATVRDLVGRRLGECLCHWKNFGRPLGHRAGRETSEHTSTGRCRRRMTKNIPPCCPS